MMDSSAASVHAIPARWTTIESSKSFTKTHTKTTRLCADEGPGDLRPTSELPPIYVGKSSYDVVIPDRSDYFSLEAFESANHASDSTKAQAHRRCLQYSPAFVISTSSMLLACRANAGRHRMLHSSSECMCRIAAGPCSTRHARAGTLTTSLHRCLITPANCCIWAPLLHAGQNAFVGCSDKVPMHAELHGSKAWTCINAWVVGAMQWAARALRTA